MMKKVLLIILVCFVYFTKEHYSTDYNFSVCPIDFTVIWQPYNFYYDSSFKDRNSPHPMWYEHFIPLLDSLKSINSNYVHARLGAKNEMQAPFSRPEHPRFWETGFLRFDAAIKWMQDRNLEVFITTCPLNHYADSITILPTGDKKYFGDDSGYYWFWFILAERYINLKQSINTPWGQICSSYTSYRYVDELDIYPIENPVLYWEICSEPENSQFFSWGGYYDSKHVLANGDTLFSGDHARIEKFVDYIKISSKAIRDATDNNPDVKIIGPAVLTPLCCEWDTALYFNASNCRYEHYTYKFGSPEIFWGYLKDKGVLDCFDIISVHCYTDLSNANKTKRVSVDTIFYELDRLRFILDSLGYGPNGDYKPIWITEIGWQRNWFGHNINYPNPLLKDLSYYTADYEISTRILDYIYRANQPSRFWLEKTFIWSLCDYPYPNKSTPTDDYSNMYRPCVISNDNIILYDPIPFRSFEILKNIDINLDSMSK